MTPKQLLIKWLSNMVQPNELSQTDDKTLWLQGWNLLQPWETELMETIWKFGPIPRSEQDQSLIDKGFVQTKNGFVAASQESWLLLEGDCK